MSENTIRKITRGYQITLPKFFRDKTKLEVGDYIEIVNINDQFYFKPVKIKRSKEKILESIKKSYLDTKEKIKETEFANISEDEVIKLVDREKRKTRRKSWNKK